MRLRSYTLLFDTFAKLPFIDVVLIILSPTTSTVFLFQIPAFRCLFGCEFKGLSSPGGGGVLYISWVRGRAIEKGIDFHDFGIRNCIDFHGFGIRICIFGKLV